MWILGLKGLNNQGACSLNEDYNKYFLNILNY